MPINVGDLLVARYDWAFVAGSYVISVLGSLAALHHTPYLFLRSGKINWNMAIGAAVSLGGIGIWAMHFIGMMGYRLALPVVYDAWWTFVSLAAAIVIAGIALIIAGGRGKFSLRGWLLGSALAGAGVCVMHYLGMYAMNLRADMTLRPAEVLMSVLIAVSASGAALWLAFHVTRPIHRVLAAMTMGLAVCAMHYTGMAAGEFVCIASNEMPRFAIGGDALPVLVTTVAAWVLVMLCWNLLREHARLPKELVILSGMAILAATLFYLDTVFPKGQTTAALYAAVVGATLWLVSRHSTLIAAAVCTVLTGLGFVFSADGPIGADVINRGSAVISIWTVALICVVFRKNQSASAQLAAIVESSNDAIIGMNLDRIVVSWNRGAERLFGYHVSEIIGRDSRILFPPACQQEEASVIDKARHGQGIEHYQSVRIRKDGSHFPVSISATPSKDAQGGVVGVAVIARDISEAKRSEEELREAKEAAEAGTRAKSEFLANMSHEIRTPLNGVIGMIGLLLQTPLGDRQRQYATTAGQSGETLLALINDILDYSKIEAGQMQIENVPFNLRIVMEDVVAMLAEKTQPQVECLVDFDSALPKNVIGDPVRMTQVLGNLAGNAVKFTSIGQVVVRARMIDESRTTVRIRFEVSDTGIGMDAQQRARIFKPFSQADTSTTRLYGGTGLGLVIVNEIVKHVKGELGFESEPGRGSLFWFSARFRKAALATPLTPETLFDGTQLRVLVVDDNEASRSILQDQLRSWKVRHSAASAAASALQMMQQAAERGAQYDVILIDSDMPGMSGTELVRLIKADPRISAAKLILLARAGSASIDQHPGLEVAAWIEKPVRQSALFDCLLQVSSADRPDADRVVTPAIPVVRKAPQARGTSVKILVAEDNMVNQQVMAGILAARGYQAELVANGREALAAVERGGYDMVLMDCQMPIMDGYTATGKIRALGGAISRIPIIAITAHALAGEREKCLSAGMDDYLSKPIRPAAVYDLIERWSAEKDSAAAAEAVASQALEIQGGFDSSVLAELRELDPTGQEGLVAAVVATYLQDAPLRLQDIRIAVSQQDAGRLRQVAHALRGSSACVGAMRMTKLSGQLEELAGMGSFQDSANLIDQLEHEFVQVGLILQNLTVPPI